MGSVSFLVPLPCSGLPAGNLHFLSIGHSPCRRCLLQAELQALQSQLAEAEARTSGAAAAGGAALAGAAAAAVSAEAAAGSAAGEPGSKGQAAFGVAADANMQPMSVSRAGSSLRHACDLRCAYQLNSAHAR